MAFCCSFIKLSKSSSSERLSKEEELAKSLETPVINEPQSVTEEPSKSPVIHEPQLVVEESEDPFEFRSRTVSEPSKPRKRHQKTCQSSKSPTPSLRDIPEETQFPPAVGETGQHVIANPSITLLSESSLSLPYHTPPSSRRSLQLLQVSDCDGHPLSVKVGGTEQDGKKQHRTDIPPPSSSQLLPPQECVHIQEQDRIGTLIKKIDEVEQERQKQHKQLTEMISELSKKLDVLETELHSSRNDPDVSVNSDAPQSPERVEHLKMNESPLPHNSSVNTDVLLGLAELLPKWKFLARRLQIQEHEIQQISENYPGDVQEQSYQMLLRWNQSKVHNNDSYNTLGEAVRKAFGDQLYFSYVTLVTDTVNSCTRSQ